jgi:hypothetical protein
VADKIKFFSSLQSASNRLSIALPTNIVATSRRLILLLETIVEEVNVVESNLPPSRRKTVQQFIQSLAVHQLHDSQLRPPPNTLYLTLISPLDTPISASALSKIQAFLEHNLSLLQYPVDLLLQLVKSEITEIVSDTFNDIAGNLDGVISIRELFSGTCLYQTLNARISRCIFTASFMVYHREFCSACSSISRPLFRDDLTSARVMDSQSRLSFLFKIVHTSLYAMIESDNYATVMLMHMLFVESFSETVIMERDDGSESVIGQIQLVEDIEALHDEVNLRLSDLPAQTGYINVTAAIKVKDVVDLKKDFVFPCIQLAFASLYDIKVQLISKHVTKIKIELDTWLDAVYSKAPGVVTNGASRKISHIPADVLSIFIIQVTLAEEKFGDSKTQDAYLLTISAVCQCLRGHQNKWFGHLDKRGLRFEDWLLVMSDCQELATGIDASFNKKASPAKLRDLVEALASVYQDDMLEAAMETVHAMFEPIQTRFRGDEKNELCLFEQLMSSEWEQQTDNQVARSIMFTIEDFWADFESNIDTSEFLLAKAISFINADFVAIFLRRFVQRCANVKRVGSMFTVKPFDDPSRGSRLFTTDIHICEVFMRKLAMKAGGENRLKSFSLSWRIVKIVAQMVESSSRLYFNKSSGGTTGEDNALVTSHVDFELGPLSLDLESALLGKANVGRTPKVIRVITLSLALDSMRIAAPDFSHEHTVDAAFDLVERFLEMEEEKLGLQQGWIEFIAGKPPDVTLQTDDPFDFVAVLAGAYKTRRAEEKRVGERASTGLAMVARAGKQVKAKTAARFAGIKEVVNRGEIWGLLSDNTDKAEGGQDGDDSSSCDWLSDSSSSGGESVNRTHVKKHATGRPHRRVLMPSERQGALKKKPKDVAVRATKKIDSEEGGDSRDSF